MHKKKIQIYVIGIEDKNLHFETALNNIIGNSCKMRIYYDNVKVYFNFFFIY